eukprot:1157266-Pelagomonas_calceolata.AAC.1
MAQPVGFQGARTMAPGPVGVCKVVDKWALEQPIGSGSFAIVWKAHHVVDVELVAAVKEINTEKLNPKLQESLASEISVLRRTRHDNCVQLLDLMKVSCTDCAYLCVRQSKDTKALQAVSC